MTDPAAPIGAILILLTLPLLLIGLWGAIFWRGRRAKSFKFFGAAVATFVVGVAISPGPTGTPEERRAAAAAAAQADQRAEAEKIGAMTIEAFMKASAEDRTDIVEVLATGVAAPDAARPDFISCLGDYAPKKSPDLTVAKVFGWCEAERINAPEKFSNHFNDLDAEDLSVEAAIICQNFVTDKLRSPSTADFPLLDRTVIPKGRYRYLVKSYVDAQNGFGADVRTGFLCDIQYPNETDTSEKFNPEAWRLHNLTLE